MTQESNPWRAAALIGCAAVAFLAALLIHVVIRTEHAPSPGTRAVSTCSDQELLAASPRAEEVDSHRLFKVPTIVYAFGANQTLDYGSEFELALRINEAGQVACYGRKGRFDRPLPLNNQRMAILSTLNSWTYTPFVRDGRVTAAIVVEHVNEEEAPERHSAMPEVPSEQVQIRLRRSGCFGTCPSYGVELFGDGRAMYYGSGYVDVMGEHRYRVDPSTVEKLVASAKAKNLWSLRTVYRAGVTDNPTYEVMIKLGDDVHTIEDYVGESVGMPHAVTVFEIEIDQAAQSDAWIHFAGPALEHLKEERFAFQSQAAGELFRRANADEEAHDDQAILQLLKLGAPSSVSTPPANYGLGWIKGTALENALENQRTVVVNALIAEGAIQTSGKFDQSKLDAAFRAAIRGGRLDLVKRLWDAGGRTHPSLTFEDEAEDSKMHAKKTVPVTLLLGHQFKKGPWDGLEIAKWLIANGCDMRSHAADGETLLHIATQAADLKFIRYLLDQGMPASTPGRFALPALGSAEDEDIALVLLQADTASAKMDDGGAGFRRYATENHWGRVIAWLDSH